MSIYTVAVFDESGDVGARDGASRHLVVAGVACSALSELRRVVARARKKMHGKAKEASEIKGHTLPDKLRLKLLAELATLDADIFIIVVDKKRMPRFDDPDEMQRLAYTACINQAIERHAISEVICDDPSPNKRKRAQFLAFIRAATLRPSHTPDISLQNSERERAIQVADMVAWAFFQKHERGDATYAQLIGELVAGEIVLP
jgi:hypothetical protein